MIDFHFARSFIPSSLFVLILVGAGFSSPATRAEDTKVIPSVSGANDRVAVMDMQSALQTVEAGKKAKATLEKEFNAKKKMLQDEEAAIRKLTEEFKKQTTALSEEARGKRQQELQGRIVKFQEWTQKSEVEIQKKQGDLTGPIITNLRAILKEIATQRGITLVLDRNPGNVIYAADSTDLTAAVIKAFNAKYK